jgi:hypothetical protein
MNSEMMAGLINSAYTLPLKLKLRWKWENMWLAFTILGICILPSVLGMSTIPGFWSIYGQIKLRLLLIMVFSGAIWGIGILLAGLAVDLIRVAAMFATVMGTSATVGAILPLFIEGLEGVSMRAGLVLSLGIALWGVVTGEWKNASRRARVLMGSAVCVLVVAIIVLTGARGSA